MTNTRKWLIYFEIFAVFIFFVIIFVNITNSYTNQIYGENPDLDQLIEKADQLYKTQDLPRALVKYWETITHMESQKEPQNYFMQDYVSLKFTLEAIGTRMR